MQDGITVVGKLCVKRIPASQMLQDRIQAIDPTEVVILQNVRS